MIQLDVYADNVPALHLQLVEFGRCFSSGERTILAGTLGLKAPSYLDCYFIKVTFLMDSTVGFNIDSPSNRNTSYFVSNVLTQI